MRRALPFGLLLLCAGCNCQNFEKDPTCQTAPLGTSGTFVEGQPGTLKLGVGTICFTGTNANLRPDFMKAKEVIVTVVDPDNHDFPFTATTPVRSGDQIGFDTTTEVTFTPNRAGTWTVTASFEPGVGKTQAAVAVATLRTDAGLDIRPTDLPADCQQYGLLANGNLACVRSVSTGGFELAIGARRWPGVRFVIDGDAVVRLTQGVLDWQIDRVDPDAGATSPIAALPESDVEPMIASHQGQVWVVRNLGDAGTQVIQCQAADGGYVLAATRLNDATSDQAIALEDRVVVVTHPVTGTADMFFFDGGTEGITVVTPAGRLFTFPADGGSPRTQSAPLGATGVWADEASGWIFGPATRIAMNTRDGPSTLTAMDLAGPTPRFLPLAISRSQLRTPPALSPASPVFPSNAGGPPFVLTFGAAFAGYEVFDPGPDYEPVVSATRTHAFARSKDKKTVKVFTR